MLCQSFHALRFCRKFLKMTVEKREKFVDRHRYCLNCLAKSHDLRTCTSRDTCRKCDRWHHTLLHPKPAQPTRSSRRRARSRRSSGTQQREEPDSIEPQPRTSATEQPSRSLTTDPKPRLSTTPDSKIIIEAIRSLAQVLCNNEAAPNVA